VRDAAAKILEHTTLADIVKPNSGKARKRQGKKKTHSASILPMVVHDTARRGRYQGALLHATDKDQD
jgi:hypothetical protein